jgi:hypothetical protein
LCKTKRKTGKMLSSITIQIYPLNELFNINKSMNVDPIKP